MDKKIEKHIKRLSNTDREEKAGLLYREACGHVENMRISTVMFAVCMKSIRDNKYHEDMGYKTFEIFCCLPEINVAPATVKKYITIIEYYLDKNIGMEKIANVSMSNLGIMKNAKEPEKYIEKAKDMPYIDFKKVIYEKELNIKPEDNEIDDYIKKQENKGCSFWDGKKCIKEK